MQFLLLLERPAVQNFFIGISGSEKFIDYFAFHKDAVKNQIFTAHLSKWDAAQKI